MKIFVLFGLLTLTPLVRADCEFMMLPAHQDQLEGLPESETGYQFVEIELTNGV